MSRVVPSHLTCKEVVELVTSYIERAIAPEDRDRFELHLTSCAACVAYYEQMLATRDLAAAVREEPVGEAARDALLGSFRAWKEGR